MKDVEHKCDHPFLRKFCVWCGMIDFYLKNGEFPKLNLWVLYPKEQ